jgi:multidrug transporter EmrE-like cation transporter
MRLDPHHLALLLSILLVPIAQVLLKLGSSTPPIGRLLKINWQTIFGLFLLLTCTLSSSFALRVIEVKTFAALSSLIYALVFLISVSLLKEKCTPPKLIGCVAIIFGILVFNL